MARPLKVGGNAWRYLVKSVTGEVGEVRLGADVTRYYAAKGTPPGRFLGAGLTGLGSSAGAVNVGDPVSPEMLSRMLDHLADPLSGKALGRPPTPTKKSRPVAGFDLTFSPPKSVSVAWAMADRGTKGVIEEILHEAAAEMIAWAEGHVFYTRSGAQGVRQEPTKGVVATSWLHYESRAQDPQIHHHVMVLNRAPTASDGRWRGLDSKALYPWIVALSERHSGLVEDRLTERFGYAWAELPTLTGADRKREVAGVGPELVAEFSTRKRSLLELTRAKVAAFEETHGRPPNSDERRRIDRAAWRETRPAKVHRSLAELTEEWTARALPYLDIEPSSFVQSLAGRSELPCLRADDLSDEMLKDVARAALLARSERHSTFTEANLAADIERELRGVRLAAGERAKAAERALGLALELAVKLSPPELHHVPERLRAPDGTSEFSPRSSFIYTTGGLLEAEARLLDAGRDTSGPAVGVPTLAALCDGPLPGRPYGLGADQAVALERLATSRRVLDVLVGPAGVGKTTALAGLLAAWEAEHGPGSVKGLASSATAAAELEEQLGIDCDNTAKWLTEVDREDTRLAELARLRARLTSRLSPVGLQSVSARLIEVERELARWRLDPGDLLVIDEAAMVGTFALDRIVDQAKTAGAKVVLVGDWAQLDAVDAGGAFGMLVSEQELAPELSEVHRFEAAWERRASVELRVGLASAVDAYLAHDRVASGSEDEMLDALYRAWRADVDNGKRSLMIAMDRATVTELNRRAREDRIKAGQVGDEGLELGRGLAAGVGDVVVTRHNERHLRLPDGEWVRNRDRWRVTGIHHDGAMTVVEERGDQQVVLPADYVGHHVELGYASTAYAAQGKSADSAHAMVTPSMTAEVLYVATTRGRSANRLYVDVEPEPPGAEMAHGPTERLEPRDVLLTVAQRRGGDLSAHQVMAAEWARAESFEQLVSEHQALVAAAVAERFGEVVARSGLSPTQLEGARSSPEWVSLLGALRDADYRGVEVDTVLKRLVADRPIEAEKDPAVVLRARLARFERESGARSQPRSDLVAGLVPRATGITDPDLRQGIEEREEAIARRARALAEEAVDSGARWAEVLGRPPTDPYRSQLWWERLSIVAAYRDRWGVRSQQALGAERRVGSLQQAAHRHRAARAAKEAARLAEMRLGSSQDTPPEAAIQASKEVRL